MRNVAIIEEDEEKMVKRKGECSNYSRGWRKEERKKEMENLAIIEDFEEKKEKIMQLEEKEEYRKGERKAL